MQIETQQLLQKNKKLFELLKTNSHWYKYLNRNPNLFKDFQNEMKEKYKLRTTDKIESAIENIDIVSNVLKVLS